MPAVPINPSQIANAVPYAVQSSAQNSKIGQHPIDPFTGKKQTYTRFVPMQFDFGIAPVYQVDLKTVSAHVPFTQIASMYVDNTQSTHDVTILFPDTGWQARVAFGDAVMLNPLTGIDQPVFFVILDSDNVAVPGDITNVFPIDSYIPPSATSIFQRSIAYGYSSMFELQPTFTQSNAFLLTTNSTGPYTLINNKQWFLTVIDIGVVAAASPTGTYGISLIDAGVGFFNKNFNVSGTSMNSNLLSLSGLNYISSGKGPLTAQLSSATGLTDYNISFNLMGGVLVT